MLFPTGARAGGRQWGGEHRGKPIHYKMANNRFVFCHLAAFNDNGLWFTSLRGIGLTLLILIRMPPPTGARTRGRQRGGEPGRIVRAPR